MSAASTRPKAPTSDGDALGLSASTASAAVPDSRQLCLDEVRDHLASATGALDGWYSRQSTHGHSYVSDGHEAIRLIDAVTRELYRVRAALVGEIRADEDEHAARVDRLIAESRARRAANLSGEGVTGEDGGAA